MAFNHLGTISYIDGAWVTECRCGWHCNRALGTSTDALDEWEVHERAAREADGDTQGGTTTGFGG